MGTKLKCDKCGEYYEGDEGGTFIPDDTASDEVEEVMKDWNL